MRGCREQGLSLSVLEAAPSSQWSNSRSGSTCGHMEVAMGDGAKGAKDVRRRGVKDEQNNYGTTRLQV